jgi:hypothetical protein
MIASRSGRTRCLHQFGAGKRVSAHMQARYVRDVRLGTRVDQDLLRADHEGIAVVLNADGARIDERGRPGDDGDGLDRTEPFVVAGTHELADLLHCFDRVRVELLWRVTGATLIGSVPQPFRGDAANVGTSAAVHAFRALDKHNALAESAHRSRDGLSGLTEADHEQIGVQLLRVGSCGRLARAWAHEVERGSSDTLRWNNRGCAAKTRVPLAAASRSRERHPDDRNR